MTIRRPDRKGATLVEAALVYPIVFLIMFAIIVLGIGVFRQHQVTHIAREASRWASVHSSDYAKDAGIGVAACTAQDVYDNAIAPQAAGMATDKLTYAVSWTTVNSPTRTSTVYVNGNPYTTSTANTVTVTVNYLWDVGPYFGPLTLSSTSTSVIYY